MRSASPSTIAVLPTPGSTDQRVERPLGGERGEVAAVFGEERQLLLLQRGLALLGDRQNLLAQGVDVEALLGEDAHRDATFDAQDTDQQVLRSHRGVQHRLGFVRGVGKDLLRFLGQRQLGGRGDALDENAFALDLAANVFRPGVEATEELGDGLLALPQDAEQHVLGLDHPASELGGLVAGEKQCPPRLLVELLEHGRLLGEKLRSA